jgi:hypothetical protein
MPSVDLAALDEERLAEWLLERPLVRLQGARRGLDPRPRRRRIHDGPPALAARSSRRASRAAPTTSTSCCSAWVRRLRRGVVDEVGGVTVYDAFADPEACDRLGRLLRDGAEIHGERARIEFHWLEGRRAAAPGRERAAPSGPSSPTRRSSSTTRWS